MAHREYNIPTPENWTASNDKLWVNVPSVSSSVGSLTGRKDAPQKTTRLPVRTTVTTLLRHHQVLKNHEKEEKVKVEGFLQGNSSFDYDTWKKEKDIQAQKEQEAQEAKRRLKAKLAYHKAIAATREVVHHKFELAHQVRNEAKKIHEELQVDKEAEMERRKALAAEIHEESAHSKRLVEESLLKRRKQAQKFKEQTLKLQQEARIKELQDFINRKEKIQQIQANKLALKAATSHTLSPAAFIGSLGSPDAEIRLKLSKEERQAELEEKRRKVQAANEERRKKLSQVKKKLEGHVAHSAVKRELQGKFRNLPGFKNLTTEDGEINELVRELQRFQVTQNLSQSPNTNPIMRNTSYLHRH